SVGYSLSTKFVTRAVSTLPQYADTEMYWYSVEKIPNIKTFILKNNASAPHKLRLTLDYQEDYWLLESVRKIVGNYAPRGEVDKLFINNPDLYKINWFRNEEWKQKQLASKINE
ncbi:MAG: hypothetical protein HQK53_00955, partial [Oligoflexia bacterium]|nr:hypothetical protein [Oligoflexia bacterium]